MRASTPLFLAMRGVNPLQEEGGVADISEADRDAMEARKDLWSKSGDVFIATASCPKNNCMYRKSLHSQTRSNSLTPREKQKKQFGQLGREQYR